MIPDERGVAVYALTAPGAVAARRLRPGITGAALFLPHRLADASQGEIGFDRLTETLARNFTRYSGHVVFAAAGLVVRALAGCLQGKNVDPGVVVVDPEGEFAVSLIGGHLGGANDLARSVAAALGGRAVITTATEAAGLPGLDVLAARLGLAIENLPALARIGRTLVEGGFVGVHDPLGWLWPALADHADLFDCLAEPPGPDQVDRPLVMVGPGRGPFPAPWLILRPPCLVVGIGCNRGTPAAHLIDLVERVLADNDLAPACLARLATAELKRDEAGILELAEKLGLEIDFFSTAQLEAVDVPNPSGTVRRHVGAKSVCEAAAILAAPAGRLWVPKTRTTEATVAVALRPGSAGSTWSASAPAPSRG